MQIVLASSSRYRAQLLSRIVPEFDICSPQIDERRLDGESGSALATRLARLKARKVATGLENALVIGSDQVAMLAEGSAGERILGKPGDFARAREQLMACSNREVIFQTACCVIRCRDGELIEFTVRSMVRFRPLQLAEIETYLHRDQPYDCAGSIRTEGLGIALLAEMEVPDQSALVGLPLLGLARALCQLGYEVIQ